MSRFESVLITGANRGIGLEFTRYYLENSRRVIACCRAPDKAFALQALQKTRPGLEIQQLDVSKASEIQTLYSKLHGQVIDLIINNAGIYGPKGSEAVLDHSIWSEVFAVNVMAPIEIARQFSSLQKLSNNAVVANITSKMGSITDNQSGGATIYRSSKAALNAATKSFALDHAALGICTVLLHPGWVQTDMGGPNALIDVTNSVKGMTKVLENLDKNANGAFFNYDGSPIPW